MTNDAQIAKRTSLLLVEDEPDISVLVCEVLAEQGFDVRAAANGGDALRYLASGQPVDILFTDINLPGNIDGAMLAQKARQLRPDLPVAYTSGRRSRIETLNPVEGSMFVPKPYDPFNVGRLLDYLVAVKRMPPQCNRTGALWP